MVANKNRRIKKLGFISCFYDRHQRKVIRCIGGEISSARSAAVNRADEDNIFIGLEI
jgi:hypothetical protein